MRPWARRPSLPRGQRRILAASLTLGLALVIGQPSFLAKSPCIWASADVIIQVTPHDASVNETEVRAFVANLAPQEVRPASIGDPYISNGNFTQPVHFTGDPRGAMRVHTTRLLFTANESAGTAQVDIHVYLRGPELARVDQAVVEVLRDSANREVFDLTQRLREWFGPAESRYHGNGSGTGDR